MQTISNYFTGTVTPVDYPAIKGCSRSYIEDCGGNSMSLCAAVIADEKHIVLGADSRVLSLTTATGALTIDTDEYQKVYYFRNANVAVLQCGVGYFQMGDGMNRKSLVDICTELECQLRNENSNSIYEIQRRLKAIFMDYTNVDGNESVNILVCGYTQSDQPVIITTFIVNGRIVDECEHRDLRNIYMAGLQVSQNGCPFSLYNNPMKNPKLYWETGIHFLIFTFIQMLSEIAFGVGGEPTVMTLTAGMDTAEYIHKPLWYRE